MKIINTSPLHGARWPWPKMDLEEVVRLACENKLYMPNIGYLHIPNLQDWTVELGDAANSKRLWINSLVSAHACLELSNTKNKAALKQFAKNLLVKYFRQYDSDKGIFTAAWKDEHAVANRLFVITAFLHDTCCNADDKYISQLELLYHAERHAEWLLNDAHYVQNNHGVMMDLALAQFAVFIGGVDSEASERYLAKALRRLEMMLDSTFDSEGCCTENSPTYHFVNYALFSSIEQFIRQYSLIANTDKWVEVLRKAKYVGRLFLRADGTIPLVGDSECRPGTFFPHDEAEAIEGGVGYFPEAGFFVANHKDMQLTLRAGGAKFSHRHVDDLSMTLWIRGRDFIVDGGMYNYDIQDKLRRWFISSRAHSGFYLESSGDVRFANFDSPAAMSHFESMRRFPDSFTVRAVHNLSKEARVNRCLRLENSILHIDDSFVSDSEQRWRSQFIFHPCVEILPLDEVNGFRLKNEEQELVFRVKNREFRPAVECSNYSPAFMQSMLCKSIVIRGQSRSLNLQIEILI